MAKELRRRAMRHLRAGVVTHIYHPLQEEEEMHDMEKRVAQECVGQVHVVLALERPR